MRNSTGADLAPYYLIENVYQPVVVKLCLLASFESLDSRGKLAQSLRNPTGCIFRGL